MRHLLAVGILAVCGFALSAPVPKDKDKVKDEEAILGTWAVEKFEGEDGPPPEEVKKLQLVFQKDGVLIVRMGGKAEEKPGKYTLDPNAKPKSIDLINNDDKALGIYELEGDTLKLCVADGPKSVRPTELKAGGKNLALVTLKRLKEEPKKK